MKFVENILNSYNPHINLVQTQTKSENNKIVYLDIHCTLSPEFLTYPTLGLSADTVGSSKDS